MFMPARDEEKNLPLSLEALLHQTVKPSKVLLINDASIDGTEQVAKSYGIDVITLTEKHDSYASSPEVGWMLCKVWNHAFPPPENIDYIMQTAPDAILPLDYTERLIALMEQDDKLVVASGVIEGERTARSYAQGVGRLYKAWFWNKHIKQFPLMYCTESYPLLKAQSLGLHVRSFPSLVMKTQRPTQMYKSKYGYAMRELGYLFPFALHEYTGTYVY